MATLLFGIVKYKTPEYLFKKLDGWTAKGPIALKGPYHYTFLDTEPQHSKGISVIVQQSAGLICHRHFENYLVIVHISQKWGYRF